MLWASSILGSDRMKSTKFQKAIECVILAHEGGFQCEANDPGNYRDGHLVGTKWGISAKAFPNVDIKNLTISQAEDLYSQVWGKFDLINDLRVLIKALDLAVNMQWAGHGPATEIIQRALDACGQNVVVDETFGPGTAAACNAVNASLLLQTLCEKALEHYQELEAKNPKMASWFKNWNHRATWLPPESIQL